MIGMTQEFFLGKLKLLAVLGRQLPQFKLRISTNIAIVLSLGFLCIFRSWNNSDPYQIHVVLNADFFQPLVYSTSLDNACKLLLSRDLQPVDQAAFSPVHHTNSWLIAFEWKVKNHFFHIGIFRRVPFMSTNLSLNFENLKSVRFFFFQRTPWHNRLAVISSKIS